MSAPLVTIVIPVGPAHAAHVATAVGSCLWQTVPDWRAIVVNDTGGALPVFADPRVTVIDAPPGAGRRASIARNAAFQRADTPFVVPLDADDYLLPSALDTLLRGHALHDACYSYAWHYGLSKSGNWGLFRSPAYDRQRLSVYNLHPITALVPTAAVQAVGGCDEDAPGLEDWTLWIRLAQAGYCGEQVYGPVFVYRRDEGVNHIADVAGGLEIMDAVTAPYRDARGEIPVMACGCSGDSAAAKAAARGVAARLGRNAPMSDGLITLEYVGKGDGAQWFKTPSGAQIRAGRGPAVRYVQVAADVAAELIATKKFVQVAPAAPFVPPPDPATVLGGTVAESATFAEPPPDGQASPFPGTRARKTK